jgi:hypothetical protein
MPAKSGEPRPKGGPITARKAGTQRHAPHRPTARASRRTAKAPIEILVLSASRAAAYEPSRQEVCISITDPKGEPVSLSPKFAGVLRLSFSDIVEPIPLPTHQLFADEHAAAIIAFVDRWRDVERIVVHCVAGLGRSPGVALAIADLHGWPTRELEERFPMWNRWVRQQLVSAGGSRDSRHRTKPRG